MKYVYCFISVGIEWNKFLKLKTDMNHKNWSIQYYSCVFFAGQINSSYSSKRLLHWQYHLGFYTSKVCNFKEQTIPGSWPCDEAWLCLEKECLKVIYWPKLFSTKLWELEQIWIVIMPYNFVLSFWNPSTSGHTEQLKQWQLRDTGLKHDSLLSHSQ